MGKENSKLKPKELSDLVNLTEFNKKEISDLYMNFRQGCPTGQLTKDEFRKVYSLFFPHGDASEFSERVFDSWDSNRDGTIDFREFLIAINMTHKAPFEDKLRWAFGMYDTDGNNYITKDEMLEVLRATLKMVGARDANKESEEKVERIFGLADKDSDEKLSVDEFIEAAGKIPDFEEVLRVTLK